MAPRLDQQTDQSIDPNTFLRLYREIRAARTPMESAVGVYRNARKRAKAAGVDEFALSIMERLAKMEAEPAGTALRNLFKYAGWTNTDLGIAQGDLFDASPEQQPTTEAQAAYQERIVEEAGIIAGRAGQKIDDNPHHAGSAHHVAWVRGWHRGQEDAVHRAFGNPAKPGATRRARNPRAETRDVIGATEEKLNADAKDADDGKVVSLGSRKRPVPAKGADKASAKAAKAAAKLAGTPAVDEAGTPTTH